MKLLLFKVGQWDIIYIIDYYIIKCLKSVPKCPKVSQSVPDDTVNSGTEWDSSGTDNNMILNCLTLSVPSHNYFWDTQLI